MYSINLYFIQVWKIWIKLKLEDLYLYLCRNSLTLKKKIYNLDILLSWLWQHFFTSFTKMQFSFCVLLKDVATNIQILVILEFCYRLSYYLHKLINTVLNWKTKSSKSLNKKEEEKCIENCLFVLVHKSDKFRLQKFLTFLE